MSLKSLLDKLSSTDNFKLQYKKLLVYSVRKQFQNLEYSDSDIDKIDFSYLISCASLLAQSKDGKHLEMAYRICQTGISDESLAPAYHSACGAIFNLLLNSPSIKLAQERNYISDDYLNDLPLENLIDIKKKHFNNTIENGDKFILLNDFQKDVYDAAKKNNYLSISAPTSVGKSFILLQIIKDTIVKNSLSKIVYIVPTRALIQQVELDIRELLKNNHCIAEVSSVPIIPEHWTSQATILVFTQERLQWFLNENSGIHFDIIIVDEAQKVGDGARGILLQQVLQQTEDDKGTQYIFASPMAENPEEVLNFVNKDNPEQNQRVLSEITTVNQNLICINKQSAKSTKWVAELLYSGERINLGCFNSARVVKSTTVLPILAYTVAGEQKGNLIYCNYAAEAEIIALQLMSLIQENTSIVVSQRVQDLIALIKKTIHPNYVLAEVLKAGVAFHYGNMPLNIRNEIEELFKKGDISYLVCTSTLIEGVNLPAKTIFMRGPKRGRKNPMTEIDFWNLAGRAGRQGKEFQGNIICIDTENNNVWKTSVPFERKKYLIKGAVDSLLETKFDDLITYIKSNNYQINDSQFDYCYTYFLSYYLKHGKISESPLNKSYTTEQCQALDEAISVAMEKITLPDYILDKNQGVNPLSQQRLFEYFQSSDKPANELIPPYPEDEDAGDKYTHIIGRISRFITNDSYKLNYSHAILVTEWMRGYGLARIIANNIKWHESKGISFKIATIIRETMQEIEEYARFKFLKYSNCYIDILKYYFASIENTEALKQIPSINLWLEFGASQMTQISLMAMGFTRAAALEIANLMVVDSYTKADCLKWFKNNDVHSMPISPTILLEVDKILLLQLEE